MLRVTIACNSTDITFKNNTVYFSNYTYQVLTVWMVVALGAKVKTVYITAKT